MRGKDTFHKNDVGIFFGTPDKTVPDPYFERSKDRSAPDAPSAVPAWWAARWEPKTPWIRNYLYLAEGLGARIIPETEVTGVRPCEWWV